MCMSRIPYALLLRPTVPPAPPSACTQQGLGLGLAALGRAAGLPAGDVEEHLPQLGVLQKEVLGLGQRQALSCAARCGSHRFMEFIRSSSARRECMHAPYVIQTARAPARRLETAGVDSCL